MAFDLALMSSFCTAGVGEPLSMKPYADADNAVQAHSPSARPVGIELYIGMDPDLRKIASHLNRSEWRDHTRPLNACELLGSLDDNEVAVVAKWFDDMVKRRCGDSRRIVAAATFLPEISRSDNARLPSREMATRALANVMRICRLLRSSKNRHPVKSLEIVAGSRFAGLAESERIAGMDTEDPDIKHCYIVNMMSREDGVRQVIRSLVDALNSLGGDKELSDYPVLALELEPGACFILNDLAALKIFAATISDHPLLSTRVGFNLDIAHFRIAGITPEQLSECPQILERICHSHISGHHPAGHFGDVLPSRTQLKEVLPWLKLLRGAWQNSAGEKGKSLGGHATNCVSVELEAVAEAGIIKEFFKRMMENCGQYFVA